MNVDEVVVNVAQKLDEASFEPNPDIARLKVEQAEVWLRLAELLHERERV